MCCVWSPSYGDSSAQPDHSTAIMSTVLGATVDWLFLYDGNYFLWFVLFCLSCSQHNLIIWVFFHTSILVQVQKGLVRLWPHLAPVWRSFARPPLLSAMDAELATTTATRTVSGWPLWNSLKCSGTQKLSEFCMQIKFSGTDIAA